MTEAMPEHGRVLAQITREKREIEAKYEHALRVIEFLGPGESYLDAAERLEGLEECDELEDLAINVGATLMNYLPLDKNDLDYDVWDEHFITTTVLPLVAEAVAELLLPRKLLYGIYTVDPIGM